MSPLSISLDPSALHRGAARFPFGETTARNPTFADGEGDVAGTRGDKIERIFCDHRATPTRGSSLGKKICKKKLYKRSEIAA